MKNPAYYLIVFDNRTKKHVDFTRCSTLFSARKMAQEYSRLYPPKDGYYISGKFCEFMNFAVADLLL